MMLPSSLLPLTSGHSKEEAVVSPPECFFSLGVSPPSVCTFNAVDLTQNNKSSIRGVYHPSFSPAPPSWLQQLSSSFSASWAPSTRCLLHEPPSSSVSPNPVSYQLAAVSRNSSGSGRKEAHVSVLRELTIFFLSLIYYCWSGWGYQSCSHHEGRMNKWCFTKMSK